MFYVTNKQLSPLAEMASLKDAEKDVRSRTPGDYLVVQVVREVRIDPVPETTRVQFTATRTRAAKAPKPPKAPKAPKGSGS